MDKRKTPFPILLTWGLRVSLSLMLLFEIYQHNILVAFGAFCALILSMMPMYVFKEYDRTLPRIVEFAVTLALLLHITGLTFDLYHDISFWWWDRMTHFFGTAVVASLAFEFMFTLNYTGKIIMSRRLTAFFTFCVAMAIGALWEISEFYFDKIFDTHSLGDLFDTLEDLQFDAIGGFAFALFGYWYQGLFQKRVCDDNLKVGEKVKNLRCS